MLVLCRSNEYIELNNDRGGENIPYHFLLKQFITHTSLSHAENEIKLNLASIRMRPYASF